MSKSYKNWRSRHRRLCRSNSWDIFFRRVEGRDQVRVHTHDPKDISRAVNLAGEVEEELQPSRGFVGS